MVRPRSCGGEWASLEEAMNAGQQKCCFETVSDADLDNEGPSVVQMRDVPVEASHEITQQHETIVKTIKPRHNLGALTPIPEDVQVIFAPIGECWSSELEATALQHRAMLIRKRRLKRRRRVAQGLKKMRMNIMTSKREAAHWRLFDLTFDAVLFLMAFGLIGFVSNFP